MKIEQLKVESTIRAVSSFRITAYTSRTSRVNRAAARISHIV